VLADAERLTGFQFRLAGHVEGNERPVAFSAHEQIAHLLGLGGPLTLSLLWRRDRMRPALRALIDGFLEGRATD